MKILHLSTYDNRGGAAIATYRLHDGLQNIGITSQMLVQIKFSDDESVISTGNKIVHKYPKLKPHLDSLPKLFFRHIDKSRRTSYSLQWLPDSIATSIIKIDTDIIHLHWISGGLINIETIAKLNKPLVWTLHDMWAFTGGCHYNQECQLYKENCGNCPQMPKRFNIDLSSWVWERKAKAWADLNCTVVTPSHWLAKCAASSSLFKDCNIKVIPYGLDTEVYKPYQKNLVRDKFNLPQDKLLILFGAENAASNTRKGFHFLRCALEILKHTYWHDKCELVIFGASKSDSISNLGFNTHYLGRLNNESTVAQVYSAADVFVAPSIQDNLPNTVMESLACGTPCVAFDIGGMPDMINHKQNGYLSQPYNIDDLANGIIWVIEDKERHQKLCASSCATVKEKFTLELQAKNYLSLYQNILKINN